MGETKGAAREAVGWVTGDRQVEAEGRLERERGEVPDDERTVADAESQVKREHGDLGPAGEPAHGTDR